MDNKKIINGKFFKKIELNLHISNFTICLNKYAKTKKYINDLNENDDIIFKKLYKEYDKYLKDNNIPIVNIFFFNSFDDLNLKKYLLFLNILQQFSYKF